MTPQPQNIVVTGRDCSAKSSWWFVKAHQLLKCLCAQALRGAFACFSQGKWCCPGEAHIAVVAFIYLSQAFSVSFKQESQCAVILTADKWVWWCIQFVPSLAKQLNFFLELCGGSPAKAWWMRRIHFTGSSPWSGFIQDRLYGLGKTLVFYRCLWF